MIDIRKGTVSGLRFPSEDSFRRENTRFDRGGEACCMSSLRWLSSSSQDGRLQEQNLAGSLSGAGTSEITLSGGRFLSRPHSLMCSRCLLPRPHVVLPVCVRKDTGRDGRDPGRMTRFTLTASLKTRTWRDWGLGLYHVDLGGYGSAHATFLPAGSLVRSPPF